VIRRESPSSVEEVIEHLYRITGVSAPTSQRCIVPLGELVGSFNLACKELAGLTQRTAMEYLLWQGGVMELPEVQEQDPLAGFLFANTHYGCIFVEASDLLVRRRFSVAHELGHYMLHFRPLLEIAERDREYLEITEVLRLYEEVIGTPQETGGQTKMQGNEGIRSTLPTDKQMEREADRFAAELLMPAGVVRGLLARYATYLRSEDLIWRLATEMLVSSQSMQVRLQNLGFSLTSEKQSR
jgi:Zn-dependent peptidase ImmA (M78 family)